MGSHSKTGFSFSTPSLLRGIARLLDLGATLDDYSTSQDERAADTRATFADWLVVGDDIRAAIEGWVEQEEQETRAA